uniref:Ig-like domain-containing protein n=1 Tax=Poecilia latipinna TaxID=48699 RepID=A0A3B3UW57_9TELE
MINNQMLLLAETTDDNRKWYLGLEVHQSHSDLIKKAGDEVHIFCTHERTDYRVILWYQQSPGDTAMKLIGYLYFKDPTIEDGYKKDFGISGDLGGDTAKNGSLTIQTVKQDHSAVYYFLCSDSYPAYFGEGTKLTVLDGVDVTAPTVKILRPSPLECRDQKKKEGKRRKTLVCVASGFYPDHVTVFWQLNGQNITDGVATDAAAKRNEITGLYSITSRLRLQAKTWFNPDNEFSCYVTFFNGTYTNYSTSIYSWWMGSGTLFKYSLTSIYIGETFF